MEFEARYYLQELLKLYNNRTILTDLHEGLYWSSEVNPDPTAPPETYVYGITSMVENNSYITVLELSKESVTDSYSAYNNSDPLLQSAVNGEQ